MAHDPQLRHQPGVLLPVGDLPAVLLHRVRRRPLERRQRARDSTSRPATRRSSSCSCCCRRRRSAACSPASGSRRTSRTGFARRLLLARRTGSASSSATRSPRSRARRSSACCCSCVALATGMRVAAAAVDLFGLLVLALLVNLTATLFAAGVAMRPRTIQAGPAMQMPVFLILFLAPVYVPLALLGRLGPRGGARSTRSRRSSRGAREPHRDFSPRAWRSGRAPSSRPGDADAGVRGAVPRPVFVPLALVGGWVHAVAKVNPVTAILEGGRDLISGQSFSAASRSGSRSRCPCCSPSGRCAACAVRRPPASYRLGATHRCLEGDMTGLRRALAASAAALLVGAAPAAAQECDPFTPPSFRGEVPTAQQVLGIALGDRDVTTAESDRYLLAVDARQPARHERRRRDLRPGPPAALRDRRPPRARHGLGPRRGAGERRQADGSAHERPRGRPHRRLRPGRCCGSPANVHGGEESGTDASLRVLYELADRSDCAAQRILDRAVVVILPIQNPDGREADTRRNAYGFDMNRDWFARTQPETDGKLELLRRYPPRAVHRRARDGRANDTSSRPTPTRSTTRSPTRPSTGSTTSTAPRCRTRSTSAGSRTSTTTPTTSSTRATATPCRPTASAPRA